MKENARAIARHELRIAKLEHDVECLKTALAFFFNPKDPEGSSGAPAAVALPAYIPFLPEKPSDDFDLTYLIAQQAQFHQGAQHARRWDVV